MKLNRKTAIIKEICAFVLYWTPKTLWYRIKPAVLHTKGYCFLGNEWSKCPMHNDEYNTDPIRCRYGIMHLLMRQLCVREKNHVGSRITMQLTSHLKGKMH